MSLQRHSIWTSINRLALVTIVLVLLKIFTYFFHDFLPVFGEVIAQLFSAFLPFIIALMLAFLLEPLLVSLMRAVRIRRPYAAVLTLMLAIVGLSLFVFLIVARLYTELSELAIILPNYGYLLDIVTKQVETLERFVQVNPQVQSTLYASTESLIRTLQEWAKYGSALLLSVLTALPKVFLVIVVSVVATFLISASFPDVKQFISNILPRRWYVSARAVSEDLGAAIVGYLRAQTILVSVTALATIAGLLLLDNPYAVTIGVIAGILDILPIIGTALLFVPWIGALFIMGSFGEGIKLLLMYAVLVTMRQSLEPKILSKGMGIHPLPTLISMYVGLQLIGGYGLILGPGIVISYEALRRVGVVGPPRE